MNRQGGFTLLEVMIAVTVFALIAISVSQATSIAVDNQIHLERKLLASWIAENETILMRTAEEKVKKGTEELEYADQNWLIKKTITDAVFLSGLFTAKKIEVSVSLEESPESSLFTLTSFLAKD